MHIDLTPILQELDAAIVEAEQAVLAAQLRLAELRGRRGGMLAIVQLIHQHDAPAVTNGVDELGQPWAG